MKRLSELSLDAMIIFREKYWEDKVIPVGDFIQEGYAQCDYYEIYLAEKEIFNFDLNDIIDMICEDGYEDMNNEVKDDIFASPETEPFLKVVKEVFKRHPVYWEGEEVLNDLCVLRE